MNSAVEHQLMMDLVNCTRISFIMETNYFKLPYSDLLQLCKPHRREVNGKGKFHMAKWLDFQYNEGNYIEFSWRRPWRDFPDLWTRDDGNPLVYGLNQGEEDTCVPHAIFGVMTAQMNIMAKMNNIAAPKLSLRHMLEMFKPIGSQSDNGALMIEKIQKEGVVAESDFAIRKNAGVKKYYLKSQIEAGEGITCGEDDLEASIEDIKRELRKYPLIGVLDVYPNYDWIDTLYRPIGAIVPSEDQQGDGDRTLSHYVCLTGWGMSSVEGEADTPVWEFLNSIGLKFGRNGGFGEAVQSPITLSSVFLPEVEDWRESSN